MVTTLKMMTNNPYFLILISLICIWYISRLFYYSGQLYYGLRKRNLNSSEPSQKSFIFYWRFIFSEKGADDNKIEYFRIMTRESLRFAIVFSLGWLMYIVFNYLERR
jgi:hypothetical protein